MDVSKLNPEQRKAVETTEGPVLILAGAGSGKTRTLTARVARLLEKGVPAWNILALTFTNKAAKEMKERIEAMVGESAADAWIMTFHSACARILRRDIEKLGYKRSFVIYDSDDQQSLLKDIVKRMGVDDKAFSPKSVSSLISDAKNHLILPAEWRDTHADDERSETIYNIYLEYETRLKALNALDFDDLLVKTLELMVEHPPVLEYYRNRFRYVMVDEYQDTNEVQYRLCQLLTKESQNLCVVGDDDQSIYSWRGADIHNILDFEKDFPNAVVIKLEQNYRSTANILDAANQVIAHNEQRKDKRLWTEEGEGEKIHTFCADDDRSEATWVANRIIELHKQGDAYQNMAVLYRVNAQSRQVEDMLVNSGIAYNVYGGTKFYDRREVRDVMAYLRVLANPADDMSLRRIINVPRRSIGDSTVSLLEEHARENEMPLYSALTDMPEKLTSRPRKCVQEFAGLMTLLSVEMATMPLPEFVEDLMVRTGLRAQYENDPTDDAADRLKNMEEVVNAVRQFAAEHEGATLEEYLENVALITDMDTTKETDGHVTLMTVHSAKGLEFDNVFVIGMEENVFPSYRCVDDKVKLEEERRLCYVAMTRARKRLYLSRARQRMVFNQVNMNPPSRFLEEIPRRLMEDEWATRHERAFGKEPPPMRSTQKPQPRMIKRPDDPLNLQRSNPLGIPGVQKGISSVPQTAGFRAGDRVMHRKFGEGVVTDLVGTGVDARIRINFTAFGPKEFSLGLAPIVKMED
ncbi:MAG: UvrD-helicase domain-containing protein [Clostridia bacterium]|nr:UvrD-helicase domain-containing protein [Clostridia bacterium]